ncbi:MAG: hypothetical protein AW09_002696 [Candidatus Accumulibacter phosphatis]|uniref:Uncharacterized protein n=1 Tax=Candidatus Accumulibacter phosphatis TaxID=327160 RepID=A0A080LUE2_9PROT|nr:MAG: hypothetical protein AW09_002696 [Candidatus Accumulibacter phosphatis]
MLLHRSQAQGEDVDSGLSRRPARHGNHFIGSDPERTQGDRQGDRRSESGLLRSGCCRDLLPQSLVRSGRTAREHHRLRLERGDLRRPRPRHGTDKSGLCARNRGPHALRGDRWCRRLPRTLCRGRTRTGDARPHGQAADRFRSGQPDAGNHARACPRGSSRRDHGDRSIGLCQPGQ